MSEDVLVYLGEAVANKPRQRVRYEDGFVFLNLKPGAECPNGEFREGQLYLIEPAGKHGLDLVPLPGSVTSGYKRSKSVVELAKLMGLEPYIVPRIIAQVDAAITDLRLSEYVEKVDLDMGTKFVRLVSAELLAAGQLIEVDINRSGGSNIRLKKADESDLEGVEVHKCSTLTEFAEKALATGYLAKVEPQEYKMITVLLMPGNELPDISQGHGDQQRYVRVPVDVPGKEGMVATLYLLSRNGGGKLPILTNKPARALIRHLGGNTYDVAKLEDGSYDGLLRSWEKLPVLLDVPIKEPRPSLSRPEDSSIRVTQTSK